MKEFEKMSNGLFYNPVNKGLLLKHVKALRLCEKYNKTSVINVFRQRKLLKKLIPNLPKNIAIMTPFHAEYGENITIGEDFFSNFNCMFLDVAKINIGKGVMLGPNVTIATPMHPLLAEERVIQDYPTGHHDLEYAKPITIEDNVWIASGVTVCGGVTIGKNSVVGAGAVVTSDVPENVLVGGIPAKIIRRLDEKDKLDVWNTYTSEKFPISERNKEKNTK